MGPPAILGGVRRAHLPYQGEHRGAGSGLTDSQRVGAPYCVTAPYSVTHYLFVVADAARHAVLGDLPRVYLLLDCAGAQQSVHEHGPGLAKAPRAEDGLRGLGLGSGLGLGLGLRLWLGLGLGLALGLGMGLG